MIAARLSFWAYYCAFFKRFALEYWQHVWRKLALSALLAVIVFLLRLRTHESGAWNSLKLPLVSYGIVLAGFALYHLVRTPWLLQKAGSELTLAADFIRGECNAYVYKRGDSPFIRTLIWLKLHNRGERPRTVWCEHVFVQLPDGTKEILNIERFEEAKVDFDLYGHDEREVSVGPNSSMPVFISAQKYYLEDLPEAYLAVDPLHVSVALAETFGTHVSVAGDCKPSVTEQ